MKKILYFSLISSFIFSTFVFTQIVPADANSTLIENGGFELPVITKSWDLKTSAEVPGWTTEWMGTTLGDPLLEIHHLLNNPYEGDQYIELDSNAPIRVYQDFDTCAGGTYNVSYAWAPRQNVNSAIKVYWDGVEIGSHSGTGAGGALNWTLTSSGQTAPDTSVRLSVEEIGPPDSLGMYFDDVVVEEVWCPDITPPVITFEQPLDGSTHSGVIDLRATCNENCDYVNFWWRAEGQSFAWYRYHYVHTDGTVFEWDLDTLNAELAQGQGFDVMEDGTYYLYAAGKDLAGNWASTPQIMVIVDNDFDGVLEDDYCPGTVADEPTEGLGVNRHIWKGEFDNYFTTMPSGKKDERSPEPSQFSIDGTHGCSCEQILDSMAATTGFDFEGHYKFGCSKSIIEDWIANEYYLETVNVSSDETVVSAVSTIDSDETYILEASGTYKYASWAGDPVADAKCSWRGTADPLGLSEQWVSGDNLPAPYTNYLEVKVNGGVVDWGVTSGICNDTDNQYSMEYTGADHLDFSIYDGGAIGDNEGSIQVDIFVKLW
jgi:hypothetical protein